jgi:hypothetical protein
METNFQDFLNNYQQNLESPDWLSNAIVHLSAALYRHNSLMAEAELVETRVMVNYLEVLRDGKKMSVSEAEIRARAETNNEYNQMKAQGEAIIETINSIKKRLDVLQGEKRNVR